MGSTQKVVLVRHKHTQPAPGDISSLLKIDAGLGGTAQVRVARRAHVVRLLQSQFYSVCRFAKIEGLRLFALLVPRNVSVVVAVGGGRGMQLCLLSMFWDVAVTDVDCCSFCKLLLL